MIEVPYVEDLIDHVEFDTIYHEHLCYFSLTALDALFAPHGLAIVDVERLPIHGGSLRVFASPTAPTGAPPAERSRVSAICSPRRPHGAWATSPSTQASADGSTSLRAELRALLGDLKAQGKRIAAYGASAKGSTLLNYFGIGRETLDFVVDRSTVKQGRYTPGTHLPILAPEQLLEAMPDYVLLLTWNFAEEILRAAGRVSGKGGRFIVPVPTRRSSSSASRGARRA